MPVTSRSADIPVAAGRSAYPGRPSNGMTFVTACPGWSWDRGALLQERRSSALGGSPSVFWRLLLCRLRGARVPAIGQHRREQLALPLQFGNDESLNAFTELHELRHRTF